MTEPRPTTYETGAMCGKFRIEKLLGQGGMGEVYLALDTFLGRHVALKVLPFKRSLDPSFRDRMQREAAAGARIDHPNVTKILDGGATDQHIFYVVMEFLQGMRTLRSLAYKMVLPLDSALVIAIQIAEGLSAVHAAGIVHRDLKPENIAILPGGIVKIIDFGLAKVRSEWIRTSFDPSNPHQRMGTAHYMAPEQIENRKDDISSRSDVYALGCILFEAFAGGRHVFQRDSEEFPDQMAAIFAHVQRTPPRLDSDEVDPDHRIPTAIADLVERCLAKDFRARPEADEVGRELRKILAEVKSNPVPSSATTLRTQVPTDAVASRASSVPSIELPPDTDQEKSPAVLTPEAWEMKASPAKGFAPVVMTAPLSVGQRPTLAAAGLEDPIVRKPVATLIHVSNPGEAPNPGPRPNAGAIPLSGGPARTIVTPKDPDPNPSAEPNVGGAPNASKSQAPLDWSPRPVPRTLQDVSVRSVAAAASLGTSGSPADATVQGFSARGRTRPTGLTYLWHHRISIVPGLLLPLALFVIGAVALRGMHRASIVLGGASNDPNGADVALSSESPKSPAGAPSASATDVSRATEAPSSTATAAPSASSPKVSPTGTSPQTWPGTRGPGNSTAPGATHFQPRGH